jgi:hypothetical protein
MPRIRDLLRFMVRGRSRFRPYEDAVLAATAASLGNRARHALQSQLEQVAFVQRHVCDKEVNIFYAPKGSPQDSAVRTIFDEYPLAMVWCSSGFGDAIRATVWIVKDRLFSIVFDRCPSHLESAQVSVLRTLVLCDPSADPVEFAHDRPDPGQLADYLGAHLAKYLSRESVVAPLSPRWRERLLGVAAHCLPLDFQSLLAWTNGFQLGHWRVLGLPLREVAMEGSNLWVVAECGPEMGAESGPEVLCAKDGDLSRTLYLVHLEDETETPLGPQFQQAAEALVLR